MKKLLSEKAFLIELIGFVILQVFIDICRIFFENTIQIFGLSAIEMVNILYFVFLSVVFFIINLKKPKILIPIAVYSVLLIVYLGIHIVNILNFNQDILTGSELTWVKDVYFIARTYLIPVFVFYYFLCSSLTVKTFEKIITALSAIISTNIIITNIFKVSFICYASSLDKNSFITRNIFEWFYNPDKEFPIFMTSKGWFYMGNQIGLILFMLFVFVVMMALKYGNLVRYLFVLLNGIALVMIGTKVSAVGCCLVLIVGVIFAIVFGLVLKQFEFKSKHIITYTAIAVALLLLVSYSPMFSVQKSKNQAYTVTEEQKQATEEMIKEFESQEKEKPEEPSAEFIKSFSKYVNENPYLFRIEPEFLELFPMEENFKFWYDVVVGGGNWQVDYRLFKTKIYEAAIKKNGNIAIDKLFGIGYISNFPYSEQDFISQNIWFGYVGTAILIGPYILMILYGIFIALKHIKQCFIYQNAFFAVGICAPLLISYMAGHLFFGVFSITIFAVIVAAFYKFQKERYPD